MKDNVKIYEIELKVGKFDSDYDITFLNDVPNLNGNMLNIAKSNNDTICNNDTIFCIRRFYRSYIQVGETASIYKIDLPILLQELSIEGIKYKLIGDDDIISKYTGDSVFIPINIEIANDCFSLGSGRVLFYSGTESGFDGSEDDIPLIRYNLDKVKEIHPNLDLSKYEIVNGLYGQLYKGEGLIQTTEYELVDEDSHYIYYCEYSDYSSIEVDNFYRIYNEYDDWQFVNVNYCDFRDITVGSFCIPEDDDRYFWTEALFYHEGEDLYYRDEDNMPLECDEWENKINQYHSSIHYLKKPNSNTENGMQFGIELEYEFETYDDFCDAVSNIEDNYDNSDLYLERDGSLSDNSFEMISRPFRFKPTFKDDIEYLFKNSVSLINEQYLDCCNSGMHIHIDKKNFSSNEAIIYFVYMFNRNKDEIKEFAERTLNHYCETIQECDNQELSLSYIKSLFEHPFNRYRTVNLCNNNTIEVRIFDTAFNYQTVYDRISKLYNAINYCNQLPKDLNEHDLDKIDWKEFLNGGIYNGDK